MTNFIFYDLETTGTDVVFDQILQFGAILTDRNLVELDRFDIRCQLLPWIVPAPGALLVTATDVDRLDDPALPDFYSMMRKIFLRLSAWGTATFVGYNSMPFDEPFLQRAFWQTLLPPYVTVTGGNGRLDLLPLLRATASFRPEVLTIPQRDDGVPTFRLDALAPSNGFNAHNAHDAMGDVEATLFLARKLKAGFPDFWERLGGRASKGALAPLFDAGEPIFLFHHGANTPMACYYRVDNGVRLHSHATLARLLFNWKGAGAPSEDNTESIRRMLRRIALNKSPVVLTLAEAESFAGVTPTEEELVQASFLAGDRTYCADIAKLIGPFSVTPAASDAQVEETIFDGFASAYDAELMTEFHKAAPPGQLEIAGAFDDNRFRRLAMRILYVQAPQILAPRETAQIGAAISRRLKGEPGGQPWRSVADAMTELASGSNEAPSEAKRRISEWLAERKSSAA
jgi:exodeoxyribonuclease-1